jgi:hypothetical protein
MAESKTRLMNLKTVIEAWLNEEKNSERIKITEEWLIKAAKREVRKFTKAGGGVLTVPGRKRESGSFATVDSNGVDGEVALSRAMFNNRLLTVSPPHEAIAARHGYTMISYEAPLLRLPHKIEKDPSRKVACDLVAVTLDPFKIIAVEVKEKSGKVTNLDYGLVEGWFYGQLLALRAEKNAGDLVNEIKHCIQKYSTIDPSVFLYEERKFQVSFALAAPHYYFCDQLQQPAIKNNIAKLLKKLTAMESPVIRNVEFSGFWVMPSYGCADGVKGIITFEQQKKGLNGIVPKLRSRQLSLCRNIESLAELVNK